LQLAQSPKKSIQWIDFRNRMIPLKFPASLRNETGSGLLDRYAAACHKSIQRERHSTNG
jgi:hypothetical protein